MSGHQTRTESTTDTWLTPPAITTACGPFDLDPCAAPDPRPWDTAAEHWTERGLARDWHGFVWMNPPFGRAAGEWFAKLAEHGNGIGLCAARTETEWFVENIWSRADALLFLRGRPYFYHPDGTKGASNSGVPICLAAYGPLAVQRITDCGLGGFLVTEWNYTIRYDDWPEKHRKPTGN